MLGGFAWRKWCENLTDEVPRRSPVARPGISIAIRPMPKCGCDAAESAGQSLALAPRGPQRVRRRSLFFFERPRGHTCDSRVDEPHGKGPVSPRVSTASGPAFPFRQGHVRAKNRLEVMRTPDPRWVSSRRITCRLKVSPPKLRVHSLTGRITPEVMRKAFKAVKRNRGAAGLDKESIKRFEANKVRIRTPRKGQCRGGRPL